MQINRSSSSLACRVAAFAFLVAGTAALAHAQQSTSVQPVSRPPLFLAAATSDAASAYSSSADSSSSSLDSPAAGAGLSSASFAGSQPPPRRRYGRPNYSGGNSNADGSNKFAFMAGAGAGVAVGDTHRYDTDGYSFQVGAGRNWSKSFGILAQFDYDHLGLQGSTLTNQTNLYNYYCPPTASNCSPITNLDGSSHVWSFTLNPTFTLATEGSTGAYAVIGGGYYHKVTNFQVPAVGTYCDYYYGCYQYQANQTIDHYSSNAGGVNGGIGLTYKFSHFSNERFYIEARYVLMLNQQRAGVTVHSSAATLNNYAGYDFYPANSNRTTYIPITVGLRF